MLAPVAGLAALVSVVCAQAQTRPVDYTTNPQPNLDSRTLATLMTTFPSCVNSTLSTTPVCNRSLSAWDRAHALVQLFTLEELANNTGNTAPGVPRLGLPAYEVWNEALHGISHGHFATNGTWSWATSFPSPILSMASMNRTLINQIGDIISTQGRAFSNAGRYGLDSYAPNINGFRSPVWGRGQETPGEDAFFLSSLYAYEYITGMQGGKAPAVPKLVAVPKHFAGYDIENWNNNSRLGLDVNITQQDLAGYYTPQFRSAIQNAKALGLMCSYNAVNGVPSCSNSFFLQTLARDTWGFGNGFVSSDCDAVYNVYNPHGYAANTTGAVADSLRAGTDIDCGTSYPFYLVPAFNAGLVSRNDIELALTRYYSGLVMQGYFDGNSSLYRNLGWNDVLTTDAWNISYEAAVEGITLLKNDGTLPLSKSTRSVALIGPWANATLQLQGNYYAAAPYLISPLQAFRASGMTVNFVNGTTISSTNTSGFAEAITLAQQSDVIIYAGGIDNSIEAEGLDRQNITWPGNQLDLIYQLSQVGKPLVVLQMGGGQVDSSALKNNSKVNALVWGGYPGQSGGQALFDIIMGNRAPAGRLVTTQYPASYATSFNQLNMNMAPVNGSLGQTYMWYTGTPVYPFGHGLFYTNFTTTSTMGPVTTYNLTSIFAAPHPGYEFVEEVPIMDFNFIVNNTGRTASDWSGMLFASTTSGPTPRPIKWLVGIDREAIIVPGGLASVTIKVPVGALARADANGNLVVYPGSYSLMLNNEASIRYNFTLTGNAATVQKWPLEQQQIPHA
ncbi:glycoside hydrolase family 3 protein [Baudoinia panamericana UAMH 10762]|uniref:xylan 1,4-beta-xylosidase n=1 Tax=Baudoinia panamericana (strain UAMH 10762) TaxID=717646 RepID=M2NIZ7_BAUPA|nr:glycoside hydrolase family 3 protein [Baudoinia panamericana UAMH 10762]EMC99070.1 glycoside hydrolase family 3 protein [Baudoinia panamericana UAMH 10762]